MDPVEIVQLVTRLRRTFSRQPDVLNACALLERLAAGPARVEPVATPAHLPAGPAPDRPKRDRAAYMRDYRRRGR